METETRKDEDLPALVRDTELQADIKLDGALTQHTWRYSSKREEWLRRPMPLGAGGQGLVWLEQEVDKHRQPKSPPRLRAVKQFRTDQPGLLIKECVRELEAIAKFSQVKYADHFVRCSGWYKGPGSIYLATEYCDLGDLQAYVRTKGVLSEDETRTVTRQILVALAYMHAERFAHRDLKPLNILIAKQPPSEWAVKLSDFGLTKQSSGGDLTAIQGTRSFLPPELYSERNRKCDPISGDIWSAAETSYYLRTSQSVFSGDADRWEFGRGLSALPTHKLEDGRFGTEAVAFYRRLMVSDPTIRPSADEALNLAWMLPYPESCPATPPLTATWANRHDIQDLTEGSALWTKTLASPDGIFSHRDVDPFDNSLASKAQRDPETGPSHDRSAIRDGEYSSHDSHPELDTEADSPAVPPLTAVQIPDPSLEELPKAPQPIGSGNAMHEDEDDLTMMLRLAPTPDLCPQPGEVVWNPDLIMKEKQQQMWRNIVLQRPSYLSKERLIVLLDSVSSCLGDEGLKGSLPGLRAVAWSLRHLYWPNSDNKTPAGRIVHIFMSCDYRVEPDLSIELDRRRYSCLFGFLMLLWRKGIHPFPHAKQRWDAWIGPKNDEEAFWLSLDACPKDQCASILCAARAEGDRSLHRCRLCMRRFCSSHKSQHECTAQAIKMDTAHFDGLLETIGLKDMESHCITLVSVQGEDCPERMALEVVTVTDETGQGVIEFQRDADVGCKSNGTGSWIYGLPSKAVSRRHAEIYHYADRWYIRDLRSTRGTFLNRYVLPKPDPECAAIVLTNGDLIQLGVDLPQADDFSTRAILMKVYLRERSNDSERG